MRKQKKRFALTTVSDFTTRLNSRSPSKVYKDAVMIINDALSSDDSSEDDEEYVPPSLLIVRKRKTIISTSTTNNQQLLRKVSTDNIPGEAKDVRCRQFKI